MTTPSALQSLYERATPGEWHTFGPYEEGGWIDSGFILDIRTGRVCHDSGTVEGHPLFGASQGLQEADAKFIAALHNSWPAIYEYIRALEECAYPDADEHSDFCAVGEDDEWTEATADKCDCGVKAARARLSKARAALEGGE